MHQIDTTPMDQLLRYLWDNHATDLHLADWDPTSGPRRWGSIRYSWY